MKPNDGTKQLARTLWQVKRSTYPNGLPDLTPGQVYRFEDAQQAIEIAEYFIEQSKQLLEQAT